MIIDCLADLHSHFPRLQGGDLLIVAGDLTAHDFPREYDEFADWLGVQPYRRKIVIAGNHDNHFDRDLIECMHGCQYLQDSGAEFEYFEDGFPKEDEGFLPSGERKLKIWGSPWTKRFDGMNPHCMAFTVDTEEELKTKWDLIPKDIDILITHSPPWMILDETLRGEHVGSQTLYGWVISGAKPKLHVFGHVHEAYGQTNRFRSFDPNDFVYFVNASHVNARYEPINKQIRIEL